jgi:hypothetical protein
MYLHSSLLLRYGLQCGALWLGTSLSGAVAPNYSAVVFNFGLHDTNDEAADEEARDEFVPASEYVHSPLFVSICPSLLIYIVDERECERQSTTVC